MTKDFYSKLEKLLKKDSRFVDQEGDLLKSNVIDAAYKADKKLIELLFSQKEFKDKFFSKIKDIWAFNVNDFINYIQDKNFLADSYTKYRNKIGLNIDGKLLDERKEVALVWPFKDCVLEGGMTKEDEKRKEIFFNEILAQDEIDKLLAPKVLTNCKRYSQKGEEKVKELKRDEDGIIRENLIIKGNNLLALHTLKTQFQGKVKLIYIDPPYNTGGSAETFTYNNNFDHSTWLTFMKNRLEIAKEFLREDGFIAIAIDHCELFYLGILADEIFGRDNRIGIISILHNPEGRQNAKYFTATNEYLLVYSKSEQSKFNNVFLQENFKDSTDIKNIYDKEDKKGIYKEESFIRLGGGDACLRKNKPNGFYPIYVSKDLKKITLNKKKNYFEVYPITDSGQERTWKLIPEGFLIKLNGGDIYAKKEDGRVKIFEKYRLEKGSPITTMWINKKYNAKKQGTSLLENIFGEKLFSYPKSLYAVLDTLKIMTSNDDIILDFFAGSGTTGHATLELNKEDRGNRKFILVEQLDEHIKVCKERIRKVVKNQENFVYCELMKYNELLVEKIQKVKNTKELLKIWEEMKDKSFLDYNVDIKKIDETINEFKKLSLDKQKRTFFGLLNKNQLYVNLSEIEDKEFKVSEENKKINKEFYKN